MAEQHVDRLRWRLDRRGFSTPEEYEERLKMPWRAEDTRNHTTWDGGIQREVLEEGPVFEVLDGLEATLQALVTGRTIVQIEREQHSGHEWQGGENSVTITLDDGARLHFDGWGYDASGLHTGYEPPKDA